MTLAYESYKEIVATPEANVAFLKHAVGLIESIDAPGDDGPRKLHTALRDSVSVGGAPFSQPRYLNALEYASSGDWEHEEIPQEVLRETIDLSQRIHEFDNGLNLPHFTHGFEYMKRLAGDTDLSPSR